MLEKVCDIIKGGAMGKIIKDTIHANGIDIGIYTQDFENEFISWKKYFCQILNTGRYIVQTPY